MRACMGLSVVVADSLKSRRRPCRPQTRIANSKLAQVETAILAMSSSYFMSENHMASLLHANIDSFVTSSGGIKVSARLVATTATFSAFASCCVSCQ